MFSVVPLSKSKSSTCVALISFVYTSVVFLSHSCCTRVTPVSHVSGTRVVKWILLNCAPTSIQVHPPPASSFQPPPSSIYLHPAYFSLQPTLSTLLQPKYCMQFGNFPKFRPKNSKLS